MTSTRLPSLPRPRGQAAPACPYVGLVPFNEGDESFFFGRNDESDVIVANLMASRLTILYAPSGAGKTSVLRAGVLPRLHRRDEDDEELGIPAPAVAYVSAWSGSPLRTIAGEILRAIPDVGVVDQANTEPPPFSVAWLRDLMRTRDVPSLYLILDQFEEYFFYHPGDLGAAGLPGVLGDLLRRRDLPVQLLLSIREDALAGLDRFKGYVPHLFDNYLRLSHLRREAGREAIEGPLREYNRLVSPDLAMGVEQELVEAVLDEVRTGQVVVGREETLSDSFGSDDRTDIETPYLQLVLSRLWDREREQGSSVMRRATLAELGGAQTIVQRHLDDVMSGLTPEQRDVAAAVFHHLVTASGSKIALTAEDLGAWSNLPTGAVHDLLETLSSGPQRILRPIPPALGSGGSTRYEIFHDVMGAAVVDWRRRYVTERDQEAAERTLVAEREEARAAAQAARRRLRRARFVAASMAVLVFLAFGLAALVYQNSREAEKGRLLSESAREADRNSQLSLAQAVKAYEVKKDEDTREAVLMAAAAPRSQVVAGPSTGDGELTATGMLVTPDRSHVVAYDRSGGVRVVDSDGSEEAQVDVSGLSGTVATAAVAPDASQVALATDRGDVAIVDMETGRHVDFEVEGPPASLFWMPPAGDDLVLLVDATGTARTYDAASGSPVATFPGHVAEVVASADGRNVITSDQDTFTLRVWDARSAQPVAESVPMELPPTFLHSFGSTVVGLLPVTSAEVVVWDWTVGPDPSHRHYLDPGTAGDFVQGSFITSLDVNEEANQFRVASEKEVRAYSLDTGASLGRSPQLDGWILQVSLSQDGRWLATAGTDGLLVWNAYLYRPVRPNYELRAHQGDVAQVEFLSGGDALVSRGEDGTVRLWRIGEATRFVDHMQWVLDVDVSGDGDLLATASRDGKVYVLDPDLSEDPVATAGQGWSNDLSAVLFDPTDSQRLFTLRSDGSTPEAWEWHDDGEVTSPVVLDQAHLRPGAWLTGIAISRDGGTLAAGDSDGAVHLWDAETGTLRGADGLPATGHSTSGVAFDRDGKMLAAATESGLRLQDLTTGRVRELAFPNAATVVFDPSGDFLASVSSDGVVQIWTSDGQARPPLKSRSDAVRSLAFSSDGALLAGGTADGLVQIWDVESRRTVMLTRQHSAWVNDVRFVPGDNSTLISASDDDTVARWSCGACTDPEKTIEDAVRWVHSN